MELPENRALFSIREMTKICGISRASLLRLEEDGFLIPCYINPNTGYRYYDMQNVTAVGQYQRLQTIGLSRKEISDIYFERVDCDSFIIDLKQKLAQMQHFLNEYEIRHDRSKSFSIFYTKLPSVTCYCTPIVGSSSEEIALNAFLFHEKCASEGYRLLGSEPLMATYDNRPSCLNPFNPQSKCTLCIPVFSDSKEDPNLQYFPYTEAISIIGFGSYNNELFNRLWTSLFDEVEKQKLEISGSPRLIYLVAPYTGAHYKPDDFCYECMIPIKKHKK